jgi:hypothetical protein
LTQVWEIGVSNFNGAEACFRNVFNDLNEIIARQNIGIRITREFENELALLQIQIITQLGQKIDVINVNMQRVKQEFIHLIEVGFKRLFNEITKNNYIGLGNLFENVKKMFLQNAEASTKEREDVGELLSQGFEFINKMIMERAETANKLDDVKLSVIEGNIFVIYEELGQLIKMNESRFEMISNNIALGRDEISGNFGNIFKWFNDRDIQDNNHHYIMINEFKKVKKQLETNFDEAMNNSV